MSLLSSTSEIRTQARCRRASKMSTTHDGLALNHRDYRSDIDGLRCFAVVPVVFFHAGIPGFSGGYVGVDIFFVISGYLITTLILKDISDNRFSILEFYERRARRILPALFFMVICSLLVGALFLSPYFFRDMLQTTVATAVFSSNILLFIKSGYFSAISELKPLLHTWSLAVEEQYYVFFPLILVLTMRCGKSFSVFILATLAVVSLALSSIVMESNPQAAFYLLPFRAWELLTGSLLAFWVPSINRIYSNFFGSLGLAIIVFSFVFFDENSGVPGLMGLLPVGGAALIILFSDPATNVNRLLSFPPFVFLGLLSYSIYLWHQPIFAFLRHLNFGELDSEVTLLSCLGVLVLSYFSWRFIEKPFRNRRFLSRGLIFKWSLLFIFALSSIGVAGHFKMGFPDRFSSEIKQIFEGSFDKNPIQNECHYRDNFVEIGDACLLGAKGEPQIVLFGDSHADVFAHELNAGLAGHELTAINFGFSGCRLLSFVDASAVAEANSCAEEAFEYVMVNESVEALIVANRWSTLVTQSGYGVERRVKAPSEPLSSDVQINRAAALAAKIEALLAFEKTIFLVYPIPEAGEDVPNYVAMKRQFDPSFSLDIPYDAFLDRNKIIIDAFDKLGSHDNLVRVVPSDVLCNQNGSEHCESLRDGRALYYDDDHLSNYGASQVIKHSGLLEAIKGSTSPKQGN